MADNSSYVSQIVAYIKLKTLLPLLTVSDKHVNNTDKYIFLTLNNKSIVHSTIFCALNGQFQVHVYARGL